MRAIIRVTIRVTGYCNRVTIFLNAVRATLRVTGSIYGSL